MIAFAWVEFCAAGALVAGAALFLIAALNGRRHGRTLFGVRGPDSKVDRLRRVLVVVRRGLQINQDRVTPELLEQIDEIGELFQRLNLKGLKRANGMDFDLVGIVEILRGFAQVDQQVIDGPGETAMEAIDNLLADNFIARTKLAALARAVL